MCDKFKIYILYQRLFYARRPVLEARRKRKRKRNNHFSADDKTRI